MDDIAIIGLGLRFPGDASDPEKLWDSLESGESQWSEIPKDRLNVDGFYHPSGDRQGSISFRGAHFLKGDTAAFDASFFSVASEDAKAIDPQQRMLLEVSYEAIENAGLRKEDLDGSDTSVYVGSFVKDYEQICLRDPDWQPQYAATGNGVAIMANRISYFFNLHGPSMTIDTGCSGSLVCIHLAAQSLRTGESSLAIAAGAGLILTPSTMMPMTALNFLSPDGKCFTFDSRANGYGRGEGIGVVVLKRLSDAVRDNDTIRAVIRASQVNQDGRTTGITLPSKEAQVANIRSVYASAGLDFKQTAYVECHGTGTQAGDWRELSAISETLASVRTHDNPIFVGSIKPNIGHLEGAAGVAGMIKGVLALQHGKIPPNINFIEGNPDIDFEDWKVKVPRTVVDWPLPGLRRVSVNCFGFGGTNAHVILDDASGYLSSRSIVANHSSSEALPLLKTSCTSVNAVGAEPQLFCYSAQEKSGVARVLDAHRLFLEQEEQAQVDRFLRDYAYTLGCRRSSLEWKSYIVASSTHELITELSGSGSFSPVRSLSRDEARVCFVFCGQGAQWAGMGQSLMVYRVFRESLERAREHMKNVLQSPFDLLVELARDAANSALSFPHIAQPATTALQVALVDLLKSVGIPPKHVIGHSSGEIAAAYATGAISRSAAWEIAYFRGLAAISVPLRAPKLRGAMMAVGLSLGEAEDYLREDSKSAQVACVNSPRSVTLSGTADVIAAIAVELKAKNVFHRILAVHTAYHSSHMSLVELDYQDALESISPRGMLPGISMFSTVTGEKVRAACDLGPAYWARNLVCPVQYVSAVEAMMRLPAGERPNVIIELGPKPVLASATTDILSAMPSTPTSVKYLSVLSPKTNGVTKFQSLAGELWAAGCAVDMQQIVSRGEDKSLKCLFNLPKYPWNHSKSYWHESHLSVANRMRSYGRQDLIGAPTADSTPFEPRWRGFLRIGENPWLQDHQVQKTIVYPAAGMVAMVLEGARQMTVGAAEKSIKGYEIVNMSIYKAMIIPNTSHGVEVALNMRVANGTFDSTGSPAALEFSVYSKQLQHDWVRHATGEVRVKKHATGTSYLARNFQRKLQELQAICTESVNPRQLYELLDNNGMNYGPLFQNIGSIVSGDGHCLFNVTVPDTKSKMPASFEYPHLVHPTTLDSMFHSLFAIECVAMVPTFLKSLYVSADLTQTPHSILSGYAAATRSEDQGATATIVMKTRDKDEPQVIVDGLCLTAISSSESESGFIPNFKNLCTEIVWREDADFSKSVDPLTLLQLLAHKYPALSVLQVGERLDISTEILRILSPGEDDAPSLERFTILCSDKNSLLVDSFKDGKLRPFIEHLGNQGSISTTYDVILLVDTSLADVDTLEGHLKSTGVLMQAETPLVNGVNGVNGTHKVHDEKTPPERVVEHMQVVPFPKPNTTALPPIVLLMPLDASLSTSLSVFTQLLRDYTHEQYDGGHVRIVTMSSAEGTTEDLDGAVVISFLEMSGQASASVFGWDEHHFTLFRKLQRAAKGFLCITRGASMNPVDAKGAAALGLFRTLMSEAPLKVMASFDVGNDSSLGEIALVKHIFGVIQQVFCAGPSHEYRDTEFAERHGKIFIPRLKLSKHLNGVIEGRQQQRYELRGLYDNKESDGKGRDTQLVLSGAHTSAAPLFAESDLSELAPDQVEITFGQAILTSLDVDGTNGRANGSSAGVDMLGTVSRIGSDVKGFAVGDNVTALVANGAIKSTIRVGCDLVRHLQLGLIPSLFLCAFYALGHIGLARPGKSVLIHAGASAYGFAALQVAQRLGLEVYATTFGGCAEEQNQSLLSAGIHESHIFSADSDAFIADLLSATEGIGADIVYNPTQTRVEAAASCARTSGCVVNLSGANSNKSAVRNLSSLVLCANIDVRHLIQGDEAFVAQLLDQTIELMSGQELLTPVRFECPIQSLDKAIAHIQENPYLGVCEITTSPGHDEKVSVVRHSPERPLSFVIDPQGTYVLAGGLGGLGRSISDLLVANGAKHLVYLSRSGVSKKGLLAYFESLKAKGVEARSYAVDICNGKALKKCIGAIRADVPPIRGVFQCAAVIKDAVFDNMSYEDWRVAIRPKTVGTRNLVAATSSDGAEPFYIFLASSAGVIGNRGQANYAAGNSFLDGYAHQLRAQGKHAVSIDLGPVLGAGMVTEDESILDKLRANGFYGIRHQDFLTVVKHAIMGEVGPCHEVPGQIVLGVGTGGLMLQNKPADPYWTRTALFAHLNLVDMPPPDSNAGLGNAATGNTDMKTQLALCPTVDAATNLVCKGLSIMMAKAMTMLPEEVDVHKPPNTYGVDSLVAVGVRNWVFAACGVEVSVFEVLSDSTVDEMAALITQRGGYGQ